MELPSRRGLGSLNFYEGIIIYKENVDLKEKYIIVTEAPVHQGLREETMTGYHYRYTDKCYGLFFSKNCYFILWTIKQQ